MDTSMVESRGESNTWTLVYIVTVHILVLIGIALFPIPGWKIFLWSLSLASAGALGTTVAYHRGLAHRAVKLNPIVEQVLIFAAVFNGSGAPDTWIANHRNHHAKAATIEDVSSPAGSPFFGLAKSKVVIIPNKSISR